MRDFIRDMLAEGPLGWFGLAIFAGVALLLFVVLPWAIYADLHDGRRCVETELTGYTIVQTSKYTSQAIPQHTCVRYVPDPTS